jgi:hypothetical protein
MKKQVSGIQICRTTITLGHIAELTRRNTMSLRSITWVAVLALYALPAAYAQNNSAAQSLNSHPGWVQVPGELIRPDCVHEIPKGAHVTIKDGKVTGDVTLGGVRVAHYDPCPETPIVTRPKAGKAPNLANSPGTGNGWVEAIQKAVPLGSGDNIDYLWGSWVVPSNPSDTGGLNYMFNGIEPTTEDYILQPVLQWGWNGYFGGNYWVIASWLVGTGVVFYSPPEGVSPGDTLYGYTWITSESGGDLSWEVYAYDATNGAYSWITADSWGLQWNWAFAGVLESYNISSCSQFPSTGYTYFSGYVYDGYPNFFQDSTSWSGANYNYGGPSCGLFFGAFPSGDGGYLFY